MLVDVVKQYPFLEVVGEPEEGDGYVKISLRVKDKQKWSALVPTLLKAQPLDDSFGVTINKSYYLNEARIPTFSWVLLVWGDLAAAEEELQGLDSPPVVAAPPKALAMMAPPVRRLVRQKIRKPDGTVVVQVTAPLPHIQGERNTRFNRNSKKRWGERIRGGAAVDGIESEPMDAKEGMFDE